MSSEWKWSTDPFPAFRGYMSYGQNQHDEGFIAVNGVIPDKNGILPENNFRVLKIEDKILIASGQDTTNRCLLFIGSAGGFRGEVSIFDEGNGKILSSISASNACQSGIEAIVLLDVGQSVAFHATGRRTNQIETHVWNGKKIQSKTWNKQEWDRRNDPERDENNIDWIPGNFSISTLSGNNVSEGVLLENGNLNSHELLAHGFKTKTGKQSEITAVRFGRDMHNELVIAPANGEIETDRCVVLIKEYYPGCGSKRWPGFHIDWDDSVKKLGDSHSSGGSGSSSETLAIVPMDWAENIAGQFINERDYQSQTIKYKDPESIETKHPQLFIAFNGDEHCVDEFIKKVEALPAENLDKHIVCDCGRKRRQEHLIKVSRDPNFFLGANPNKIVPYIMEKYFSNKDEGDLFGALSKAGY